MDLLVETKCRGNDSIIIVHIEPQASFQKEFNKRMFIYFSRIFETYQQNIIPIAIFSYDNPRNEPTTFNMTFPFGNVLQFQYFIVQLKKLNWRKFIRQENPVAAALLSKMGYTEEERIAVKIEFFRILTRLQLNKARERLLAGFFETYLRLNSEEEDQFLNEVRKLGKEESEKVMEIMTSYERKGLEQGIEKGRQEATLEVARRFIELNTPIDVVINATGLPKEIVENLKQEVKEKNNNQ